MILGASEHLSLRGHVKSVLEMAGADRNLRVLDVGGGLNPWLGDAVSHVMDMSSKSTAELIQGDVCLMQTWAQLEDKEFDFVNCTHTLEDVRDPGFVVQQMNRVGRAGFVAVPSRHSECQFGESRAYLGYGHHRWIFHLPSADKLEAMAKFPAIASRMRGLPGRVLPERIRISRVARFVNNGPQRRWVAGRHARSSELGIVWAGQLPFAYVNGDYAGPDVRTLWSLSEDFLGAQFDAPEFTPDARRILLSAIMDGAE